MYEGQWLPHLTDGEKKKAQKALVNCSSSHHHIQRPTPNLAAPNLGVSHCGRWIVTRTLRTWDSLYEGWSIYSEDSRIYS